MIKLYEKGRNQFDLNEFIQTQEELIRGFIRLEKFIDIEKTVEWIFRKDYFTITDLLKNMTITREEVKKQLDILVLEKMLTQSQVTHSSRNHYRLEFEYTLIHEEQVKIFSAISLKYP